MRKSRLGINIGELALWTRDYLSLAEAQRDAGAGGSWLRSVTRFADFDLVLFCKRKICTALLYVTLLFNVAQSRIRRFRNPSAAATNAERRQTPLFLENNDPFSKKKGRERKKREKRKEKGEKEIYRIAR